MNVSNGNIDYVRLVREKMKHHQFMFSYKGSFSQSIVRSILGIAERKLVNEKAQVVVKKKVFHVMLECLQSICTTGRNNSLHSSSSLIMIGKVGNGYVVYSGRVIGCEDMERLKTILSVINNLSKDDLKQMHYRLLSSLDLSSFDDSGIGLIDIAKRSGNKLVYDFIKISDQNLYFVLKTLITTN